MGKRVGINVTKYKTDECPCKDCTDRSPTCHADCKKYEIWLDTRFIPQTKNEVDKDVEDFFCYMRARHFERKRRR